MNLALLSQIKKSECGTAQPSSYIAGDNILNEQYVRTTAKNQHLNQFEAQKIGYRMKNRMKKLSTCRSSAYYVSAGQKTMLLNNKLDKTQVYSVQLGKDFDDNTSIKKKIGSNNAIVKKDFGQYNFSQKNMENKIWLRIFLKTKFRLKKMWVKMFFTQKNSLVLKFVGPKKFLTFQMIEDRFNPQECCVGGRGN